VFVKDIVENPFCFDIDLAVLIPDVPSSLFIVLIILYSYRDDNQSLEGVVEVFLVVVKRRILSFLDFLLFF
jgi:hypothetical protein